MTTVNDFEEYTDVDGQLTVTGTGTAFANVSYDVKWKRNVNKVPRSGAFSEKNIPGYLVVTTKIKKGALIHADAAILHGYSLNDTPITGAAESLLAVSNVLDAGDIYEDMTDPDIAAASLIRYTLQTKAIVAGGTITIIGEDADGKPIQDMIIVPDSMGIGETLTSNMVFKKVFGHTIRGVDSTDDLGTFAVTSITGASSFSVGNPKVFDLVGTVTKGGKIIQITQPDCWMSSGGLAWTEGGKPIPVDIDIEMYDPDLLDEDVIG